MARVAFNLIGLLAVACLPLFWGCANKPTQVAGGTSTETVIGCIVNPDGGPAIASTVYLRPSGYLPGITAKVAMRSSLKALDSTLTDSLGNFVFDSIDAGTYVLECLDEETGNGALIDSVIVGESDSTIELATDTLKPLGSIVGQIQLPESLDASQVRVLVYGLDRAVAPNSLGQYEVSDLAEGTYSLRFQILSAQGTDIHDVVVASGDTTLQRKTILPGADTVYASRAAGAITADGILDEPSWNFAREMKFSSHAVSENLITVRVLWDSAYLYVSYDVLDTLRGVDGTGVIHNDDGAEFFLDTDHNGSDSLDTDDLQFMININDELQVLRGDELIQPRFLAKTHVSGFGYVTEIIIPWSIIGKSPADGLVMGVLFANNDNDQMIAAQFDWLGIRYLGNETYKRPNLWGDLVLTP